MHAHVVNKTLAQSSSNVAYNSTIPRLPDHGFVNCCHTFHSFTYISICLFFVIMYITCVIYNYLAPFASTSTGILCTTTMFATSTHSSAGMRRTLVINGFAGLSRVGTGILGTITTLVGSTGVGSLGKFGQPTVGQRQRPSCAVLPFLHVQGHL